MRLLLTFLLFGSFFITQAQENAFERILIDPDNLPIICQGHGTNHGQIVLPSAQSRNRHIIPAIFEVDFAPEIPIPAIQAFEYATQILGDAFSSPIPIRVRVNWEAQSPGVLAAASPSEFIINFPNSRERTFFPIALAEKIVGEPLNSDLRSDIFITISSEINWYYDFENPTGIQNNQFDFTYVVLHEMLHGLGFVGFGGVTNEGLGPGRIKRGNASSIFDIHLHTDTLGNLCQNVADPSNELRRVLTGNDLNLQTPQYRNSNTIPKLYAPNPYEPGSSIYHLDLFTYFNTRDALMTPQVSRGAVIHDLGLARDILYDLGWASTFVLHEQAISIEDVNMPYLVKATVASDVGYDPSSLQLHYSQDNFATTQTLSMSATGNEDEFEATIPAPGERTTIQYYFTVIDNRGISLSFPAEAPNPFSYETFYQEDTQLPSLLHTPLTTIDDRATAFTLDAIVTDFFTGIDSVYVEYFINGQRQPVVELLRNFEDEFRDNLFLSEIVLDAPLATADLLEYRVVAVDRSSNRNTRRSPASGLYTIEISETFDATITYLNDFNDPSDDFSGNGFSVITPIDFSDDAIHSQHPYDNAGEGNTLNFIYQLNVPIQIRAIDPLIEFEEIVLVEPGEPNTIYTDLEFWDYVIVEGRKADGTEWLPFLPGYDSKEFSDWLTTYQNSITQQNSTARGTPDLFQPRSIDMTQNGNFQTGDIVFIRFRLFSDPFATGWGWAIENLKIQDDIVAVEDFINKNDFQLYPNPATQNQLTLQATFKQAIEDVQLIIYDSFGRLVQQKTIPDPRLSIQEVIDIRDYPNGIYLVTLQLNGQELLGEKILVTRGE